MCVLLFDVFKHLLLRKTDVLKTCWKSKFLRKKVWRNALPFCKSKKVQCIFWETFISALLSSAVFRLRNCRRFLVNCFAREIKGFYRSSLGNEIDFMDVMKVSPNILDKNFKKTETRFRRWTSTDNNDINIFLSLENPFYLWKKRPENAFLALIVNYRKIVQKSKLCHSKQQ